MKVVTMKSDDVRIETKSGTLLILAILGLSDVIAFFMMIFIFIAERCGLTPWFSIDPLPELTWGENFLLFMATFVVALSLAIYCVNRIVVANSAVKN